MIYKLIATATFGLEAIVASELKELGYEDLTVENGKVTFEGDEMDIAICNIWLRTADRVLIKMGEFEARSFEELFQGTKAIEWGDIVPINGFMHVNGKSVKSLLHSVPDCQSIVKKAIIESMKNTYNKDWFNEDGPVYKIEVAILKDVVTLTIDTTGPGLHKRGYRSMAGEAPLKETLAAAMVMISKWEPSQVLADVFCGSATIPIEAALIARNIAPGLNRSFTAESWPGFDEDIWEQVRDGARKSINKKEVSILASDIDGRILKIARQNIEKAGVADCISVQKLPMQEFTSRKKCGVIISNPPYGERLGDKEDMEGMYKEFGSMFRKLDNWSLFALTSYEEFQRFFAAKADKNRKLYNGRLQCYYYQYLSKKGV